MNDLTPIPALIGGALIGLAASVLLLSFGKVAGISGLYGGALRRGTSDRAFRLWFLAGLVGAAGLLVGVGTQLGNGCTSGHGVCGISRLSIRSLVATGTFMATGFATVFIVRHLIGGGR